MTKLILFDLLMKYTFYIFKSCSKLSILVSFLVLLLITPVYADDTLESANFSLDNVNFATNLALTSTQDGEPPVISSEGPQVGSIAPTSVTITWKTDKISSSTAEYGTSSSYGQSAGSAEQVTEHSVTLFGLLAETVYHFRVVSEDAFGGTSQSSDGTFTTPASTEFQEVSISQITYTSALVKVVSGGLVRVKVSYGTTATVTSATKEVSTVVTTAENNFPLTDLKPGTKYYLRLEGVDSDGGVARLNGLSFTTIGEPSVISFTATATSPNEATVIVQTTTPTTATLEYKSESDVEPQSAGDTTMQTLHTLKLTKLFGNTEYAMTATVTDAGGKRFTTKSLLFRTLADTEAPKLSDLKLAVTKNGEQITATARWEANEPVVSTLTVTSKTNRSDITSIIGSETYAVNQILAVSSLSPRTPYTLEVTSTDKAGNKSTTSINFVTPSIKKSILELILQNLSRLIDPLARLVNSF